MDVELKHTWRVSRKAWYIRFYVWLWDANDEDITFCKLWWGYVFTWLALPVKLLAFVMVGVLSVMVGLIDRLACVIRRRREAKRLALAETEDAKRRVARQAKYEQYEERKFELALRAGGGVPDPIIEHVPAPQPSEVRQRVRVRVMQPVLEGITYCAGWASMHVMSYVADALRWTVGTIADVVLGVVAAFVEAVVWVAPRVGRVVLAMVVLIGQALIIAILGIGYSMLFAARAVMWLADRSRPVTVPTGHAIGRGADAAVVVVGRGARLAKPLAMPAVWCGLIAAAVFVPGVRMFAAVTAGLAAMVLAAALLALWLAGRAATEPAPRRVPRLVGKVGGWLTTPLAAILVAFAIMVVAVVHSWLVIPIAAGFILIVAGSTLIGLGLGFLVAWAMVRFLAPAAYEVAKPVATVAATGGVGFWRMMLIGYKAVKSNTCPRVEVEE